MVFASTLLRLSSVELKEAIQREVAENPALELLESQIVWKQRTVEQSLHARNSIGKKSEAHRISLANWEGDGEDTFERIANHRSPLDQLLSEAMLLVPADDLNTVLYLVQSLDEQGYLRTPENDIARSLGIPVERVDRGILWLHKLDPPGIGARDLRECFLLQCNHLATLGIDCTCVAQVLLEAWDCFTQGRWECVSKLARLSRAQVNGVLQFMRANLYPYPMLLIHEDLGRQNDLVRPDLIVHRNLQPSGAKFAVEVAAAEMHDLKISDAFRHAKVASAGGDTELTPGEREWVTYSIDRARQFIDALEQRLATLRSIGNYVVAYQENYFEQGPRYLKPLTRAAVAAALGVHESTVSRAVSEKVLQMPDGRLIEFSDLFDGSIAAKEAIRQVISNANRPLSDREIAENLQGHSIDISRRTVIKYRAQMGIPTTSVRKPMRDQR